MLPRPIRQERDAGRPPRAESPEVHNGNRFTAGGIALGRPGAWAPAGREPRAPAAEGSDGPVETSSRDPWELNEPAVEPGGPVGLHEGSHAAQALPRPSPRPRTRRTSGPTPGGREGADPLLPASRLRSRTPRGRSRRSGRRPGTRGSSVTPTSSSRRTRVDPEGRGSRVLLRARILKTVAIPPERARRHGRPDQGRRGRRPRPSWSQDAEGQQGVPRLSSPHEDTHIDEAWDSLSDPSLGWSGSSERGASRVTKPLRRRSRGRRRAREDRGAAKKWDDDDLGPLRTRCAPAHLHRTRGRKRRSTTSRKGKLPARQRRPGRQSPPMSLWDAGVDLGATLAKAVAVPVDRPLESFETFVAPAGDDASSTPSSSVTRSGTSPPPAAAPARWPTASPPPGASRSSTSSPRGGPASPPHGPRRPRPAAPAPPRQPRDGDLDPPDGRGRQVARVGGTALGGGTLRGLGRLLLGTDDHERLVALAATGDRRRVDLLVGDLYRPGGIALCPT